jgi:hypothetical protein
MFQIKVDKTNFISIFPIFHIGELIKICGHGQFMLKSDTLHVNVLCWAHFENDLLIISDIRAKNFSEKSEKKKKHLNIQHNKQRE